LSLFGLFDIGKSAMFASQAALNITSHNIANVNTPGFSRQEVILSISRPVSIKGGFVGRGVTISGIKNHYNSFIQSQLLGQSQSFGRSVSLERTLSQVEQIFNETQDAGLLTAMDAYFNAWQDVSANPEGQTQRMALLQKAGILVSKAKGMEQGMLDILKHTGEEITDITDRINSLASSIASLNEKIIDIEGGTGESSANDLRDQRNNLMNELGQLTEFSSYESENGMINITVGMKNLVSGKYVKPLVAQTDSDGMNISLDGTDITSLITKGELGGLLAVREDITSGALKDLRKLVASITKEVNLLHASGFGLDSSTGNDFFTALQISSTDSSSGADVTSAVISNLSAVTLDEYTINFDAADNYYVYAQDTGALVTSGAYVSGNTISFDGIDVVLTGAVTQNDVFTFSPLTSAVRNFGTTVSDWKQVAASSTAAGLPGNNDIALQISDIASNSVPGLGGITVNDFYRGIVYEVGTNARAATDSLQFDENLLAEISNSRDSISGVSLDEEALNLIRFQRSFEASARMIKVTDELLQTVLNL
jgi:flagellar hook-associated protein 1